MRYKIFNGEFVLNCEQKFRIDWNESFCIQFFNLCLFWTIESIATV